MDLKDLDKSIHVSIKTQGRFKCYALDLLFPVGRLEERATNVACAPPPLPHTQPHLGLFSQNLYFAMRNALEMI